MKEVYLSYKVEDFVTDEAFIGWVNHDTDAELWNQWISEHPKTASTIAEAKEMITFFKEDASVLPSTTKNNLWKNIDAATAEEATVKTIRPQWTRWAGAAAAVLILGFLAIQFFTGSAIEEYVTENSEMASIDLPDQSRVRLNSGSTLSYDKDGFNKKRKLNLTGEAFFEVEKGSSFIVDLEYGSVEVLGTSFNIYARADSISVVCYTGKVSVKKTDGSEVILTPGMITSFSSEDKDISSSTLQLENDPLWLSGRYEFIDRPLEEIMSELERQFDITINYPQERAREGFNYTFDTDNLEKAVESLAFIANLEKFKIEGKAVSFSE